ncbi:MAG: hypothetical protein JXA04_01470 [Gammaproteobacteria bacterium]|nr:hypothetical protein [Gammaproteobacteria bacterium]
MNLKGPFRLIGLIAICLLILGLAATQPAAKDIDGEFVVFSAGANTCTDYLVARRIGRLAMEPYRQWLSGYLSAFNLIVVNTYDIVGESSYTQITDWLDRYCAENKEVSFVNASATLTVSLYPQRHNLAPNKDTRGKWLGNGHVFSAENSTRQ